MKYFQDDFVIKGAYKFDLSDLLKSVICRGTEIKVIGNGGPEHLFL